MAGNKYKNKSQVKRAVASSAGRTLAKGGSARAKSAAALVLRKQPVRKGR